MNKSRFHYSLRVLFVAQTIAAVAIAFIATHSKALVAAAATVLLLEAVFIIFTEAWPEFKKPRLAKPLDAKKVPASDAHEPNK